MIQRNGFCGMKNKLSYNIAVITPHERGHYSTNTILDGLIELKKKNIDLDFRILPNYPSPFDLKSQVLSRSEFISYAKNADLIILAYGKNRVAFDVAHDIQKWEKTVYIDGSEVGGNLRYDKKVQEALFAGSYCGNGAIHNEMYKLCGLYFKREKPYFSDVIPFPFGIESRYVNYKKGQIKDIDFVCIFGQEEYPMLRKEVRKELENFCDKNNFVCHTTQTNGFVFEKEKIAGRDKYYDILARSKVGISVGGGGFDTARFWETLANNCLLLTEKIDIYREESNKLNYKRIYEFKTVEEFKEKLEIIAYFLRSNYEMNDLIAEYEKILKEHGSTNRVLEIFNHAREKGIIV